ncbi:hypothetical protein [Hymenobacter ruricola]|uniref:Uncharacterized protein n=1 Tax=Hymenobacter ruricola TaxID=2791023 RepID=A0ABS0I1Z8_9BACT|nr:hypothetical protein [Hymenobacter ruricola]MBF9220652.1 hypothetical protein [Hymenobacter ruricola]
MRKLPLPNLHDAAIEKFTYVPDAARLIVSISKYAIDDQLAFNIELIFSGIRNAKKVVRFDQCIQRILQKEQRSNLSFRIDSLTYCDLLPGEDGLCFVLDIDHLGSLRINCKKMFVREI